MKVLINIFISIILFGLSRLILGTGPITFIVNNFISIGKISLSIFSSVSSLNPDMNYGIELVKSIVFSIGFLLVYYFIADVIRRIFIHD